MADGFFENLGKLVGPKLRHAGWVFRSVAGGEAEAVQAEFAVGRDLAAAMQQNMPVDGDPEAAAYFTSLGMRLAPAVKDRHRRFTFQLLAVEQLNAFALPGGFVYVTRPLLEFCQWDEHQMAFILGHEMGHIVCRHAMDRLVANTVIGGALQGMRLVRPMLGQVAGLFLQRSYSQDQELEADSYGAQLAARAGYDPAGAAHILGKLSQLAATPGILAEYFSSHPPFALRLQNLERLQRRASQRRR